MYRERIDFDVFKSKRHTISTLLILISVGMLASAFHFHGIAFDGPLSITEVDGHNLIKAYDECDLCAHSIEADESGSFSDVNHSELVEEFELFDPRFKYESFLRFALGRAPPAIV